MFKMYASNNERTKMNINQNTVIPMSAPMGKTIDRAAVAAYALQKQQEYAAHPVSEKANILVYGRKGAGKTWLAFTCPKPVHIDCFDAGGTRAREFTEAVKRGDFIIETRWQNDSWKNPHVFREWEAEHRIRKQMGYYDTLGTYMLDSVTTFADSLMYAILKTGSKKSGPRPGTNPEIEDYGVQQMTLVDYMSDLMFLPCNVIVTGHIDMVKDEVSGNMETGLLLAGKAAHKTAIPFDEQYVARVDNNGRRLLLTQNDGKWQATTRIGANIFLKEEPPDIKALLQKAKFPFADKPLFSTYAEAQGAQTDIH